MFLHSAADMGDYMVVIGGRHQREEFSSAVYAYSYSCNTWTNISAGGKCTLWEGGGGV